LSKVKSIYNTVINYITCNEGGCVLEAVCEVIKHFKFRNGNHGPSFHFFSVTVIVGKNGI
jgi:hypothetical protein